MKYLIFKTLEGKNITVRFIPRKSLKLQVGRKTVAEYTAAEVSKTTPEVEIQNTKVTIRFGYNQWGMIIPTLEENGVPLYGTKNGAQPEYAVKQAAGIAVFFGLVSILFAVLSITLGAMTPALSILIIRAIFPIGIGIGCFTLAYFIRQFSLVALYVF
ncbi:MAG: hypothetical protein MK212_22605, partial [Saprospiraceae bacterium]|nr:hypothetical protein [Saprospiraceae bacterium]